MANMLRTGHKLRTIRIGVSTDREYQQHIVMTSFVGSEELASDSILAKKIGIRSVLTVEQYRSVQMDQFFLPKHFIQPIVDPLMQGASDDEPVWIQLDSSNGLLAVVPWEQLLHSHLQRPILRVPTFLVDPIFAGQRVRVALVVSSPRAKRRFSVVDSVSSSIDAIQNALPERADIHVFADVENFGHLKQLNSGSSNRVHVHRPPEHMDHSDPQTGGDNGFISIEKPSQEREIQSPWLRWVDKSLNGAAIDIVHFVCHGYFRNNRGALALSQSPVSNSDTHWSHFVEANELIDFLDRLGAWAVGFSSPRENVWAIGLRLLADRLAWQRPGPLFVNYLNNEPKSTLEDTYRYLMASDDEHPPTTGDQLLYSHPRRLYRHRAFESTRDVLEFSRISSEYTNETTAQLTNTSVLKSLTAKADRQISSQKLSTENAWQQSNNLMLDRMLVQTEAADPASRSGAIVALNHMRKLYEQANLNLPSSLIEDGDVTGEDDITQ